MELITLIKKYEEFYIFEKGLSNNTHLAYQNDLIQFQEFLSQRSIMTVQEIGFQDIVDFLAIKEKTYSRTTINREKSSIKNFLKYCKHLDLIPNDFSALLKTENNEDFFPEILNTAEIKKMSEQLHLQKKQTPPHTKKYWIANRNQLLFEILYGLGLRVSELIAIKLNDIDEEEGWCRIRGKGDKVRTVPILNTTIEKIKFYKNNIRPHFFKTPSYPLGDQQTYLFLNKNGTKLSRISVWKWIKELAIVCGIEKNISPHTFRHSCATHMIQNGADIRMIQELVGHANIQTTELYTHLFNEDVKKTFVRYHPLYS